MSDPIYNKPLETPEMIVLRDLIADPSSVRDDVEMAYRSNYSRGVGTYEEWVTVNLAFMDRWPQELHPLKEKAWADRRRT